MSNQVRDEEQQRIHIEEALLRMEVEDKAGIKCYTSMEEVFSELDCIIDEAERAHLCRVAPDMDAGRNVSVHELIEVDE